MSSWFVPPHISSISTPVFCFPYAGGGAGVFRSFQKMDSSFVAVQYPGREQRMGEAPLYSMDALASLIADELSACVSRRYAFFGHSLGAKVAYRVMLVLRERGMPLPAVLFVAGCGSPRLKERRPIHLLRDDEFVSELRRYEATPPEILDNPAILKFFMPMLRADFTISETWLAEEVSPFDVPMTVFCGTEDEDATSDDMNMWRDLTSSKFEFVSCPGGHFFPFSKPDRMVHHIVKNLEAWQCHE